ncbi:phosphopantetheine-binding protein [Streptomyces sp. NPDC006662]|uniref:phosphopantetheine-binding protein n=1 Tax=Streptomyces sp. NPDC006662 TaxID=3156902 RepID=UPI00340E4ADF
MREFALDDLARILRECADHDDWETLDLDGDISDETFEALGFDSLTLYNTLIRLELDHGIELSYDTLWQAGTPGGLLREINALPARAAR